MLASLRHQCVLYSGPWAWLHVAPPTFQGVTECPFADGQSQPSLDRAQFRPRWEPVLDG